MTTLVLSHTWKQTEWCRGQKTLLDLGGFIMNRNPSDRTKTFENHTLSEEYTAPPDTEERKRALRRIVANRRKQCQKPWLEEMSARIRDKVLALDAWRRAGTVFFYMDLPGEVMTREMIQKCLEEGKRAAVPRIVSVNNPAPPSERTHAFGAAFPKRTQIMRFYELRDFDHLVSGTMNIPEPDPAFSSCLDEEEDALMIMPGVAFDRNRNRIGYGGGFYDRYLYEHGNHPTVAVAYDFQIFDEVPHSGTDIRPSLLVTPDRVF